MTDSKALSVVASLCALITSCGAATQAPTTAAPSDDRSADARASAAPTSEENQAPGSNLPPEVAAMLEPRTCNPNLLSTTHFQEFKDSRGVKHRAFMIKPGEELCLVSANNKKSGLSEPDLELSDDPVPLDHAAGHLISVEFKNLAVGAVLVVKNHYSKTLRYRAGMRLPNQLDLVHTSICPVQPGLYGVEHWPDLPDALVLMDFSLHERSEALDCE
jgi:hypothetical protein